MTETPTLDLKLLRSFSPLDGLKNENLRALARKTALRELRPGPHPVQGRRHRQAHDLPGVRRRRPAVRGPHHRAPSPGGTPEARHPLAPILPRRCTARVASDRIEYLSIDSDLLDVLITWDQTGTYEVGELQRQPGSGGRLDDDAAAEPGLPPHSAGQPAGRVHAHAARDLRAPATSSSARATKATSSTSSSRAAASSRARRRSTAKASSSPSSAWATPSARKR